MGRASALVQFKDGRAGSFKVALRPSKQILNMHLSQLVMGLNSEETDVALRPPRYLMHYS